MISRPILWATAFILTITGIFVASNIYTLIPIYSNVAISLSVPEDHIVGAGSLFTLFYAIGLLYFGPASDKVGRRRIIVLGMLASSLSTLAVAFSTNLGTLYLFRSLQGLTLGSFAPVAFAYSFDLFSPKKRTLLLVFINTGFLMAGILGQLISSSITIKFHWDYVFYFFSICYFLLFVVSLLILPKTKTEHDQNTSLIKTFIELLKNKQLLKCYAITFTLLFSFVALYDALARFYHGTYDELFTIRSVGLIGAALSLFTAKLIDKYGIFTTLRAGLCIAIGSLILLTMFKGYYELMILSILFVASISLLIPTIITLIGTIGGTNRAKALSLYSFLLLTGASLASPIVMMFSFQHVLLLLIGFFSLNFFFGHFLSKEEKLIT
ncbi:MFS transporter [Cytobacillus spongiae]|uniref:MFS transporter n=1 Tax=Cytobacillus spongiae TaxID=2901381 RepID=UPI001F2275C6|nr:MFS transporter [Cytobacillus spongiae]UII56937.1 MFS transporter [Cytobacillus spongiae]